jgi:hypothetical protein
VGRLFDAEVQLPLAGWQKVGDVWRCRACLEQRPPRPPKAVTVCFECRDSFGVAFASAEEKMAKGWQLLGDRWVCPRCAKAIGEEDD